MWLAFATSGPSSQAAHYCLAGTDRLRLIITPAILLLRSRLESVDDEDTTMAGGALLLPRDASRRRPQLQVKATTLAVELRP